LLRVLHFFFFGVWLRNLLVGVCLAPVISLSPALWVGPL